MTKGTARPADASDAESRDALRVELQWPGVDPGSSDGSPNPAGPSEPSPDGDAESVAGDSPVNRFGGRELPMSSVTMLANAYERLGTRVFDRLRDLREDLDADLAEMSIEMAALRAAIDDVADRVQLREVRTAIDELRGDVAELRRAVLESPELEQIATLTELAGRLTSESGAMERPDVDGLTGELTELRNEMAALRRRIALKAASSSLSPEELHGIAEAVTARLLQAIKPA